VLGVLRCSIKVVWCGIVFVFGCGVICWCVCKVMWCVVGYALFLGLCICGGGVCKLVCLGIVCGVMYVEGL